MTFSDKDLQELREKIAYDKKRVQREAEYIALKKEERELNPSFMDKCGKKLKQSLEKIKENRKKKRPVWGGN